MTRAAARLVLLLGFAAAAGRITAAPAPAQVEEEVIVPTLGRVKVYRPNPVRKARGVVLLVSGDGGWNLGVIDMARRAARSTVVVGLSMPAWRKITERSPAHCWYPAGELEAMAQAVEKRFSFPRYVRPILMGYSSGATVVYGVLAQAPPVSFAGAISLGFCPDLEVARPFCGRDAWKPSYDPEKRESLLPVQADWSRTAGNAPRWVVLQGEIDKVCSPQETGELVTKVPGATLVRLPKVGHGFSVPANWGAAFDSAIGDLLEPAGPWDPLPASGEAMSDRSPAEVGTRLQALDLPLEVHWPEGATQVLVFLSGDGGWAEIDQEVSRRLAASGVAVVGWNSLRYFWGRKTPDEVRSDLSRVIGVLPPESRVFVGGYSFGAEVLPVVLAPPRGSGDGPLRRIEGLVLLAPGPSATFEISPLDWLVGGGTTEHRVRMAMESLRNTPVLCLEPGESDDSGCPASGEESGVKRVVLPGGHHFGSDFDGVAAQILRFCAERVAAPPRGSAE